MKYIVDFGSAKMIYSNLERVPEDVGKIFRFMIYFKAKEMNVGKTAYRLAGYSK